ncbi:hypothetical protein [Rhodococcus sp. IEGM 1330]|uniref:hypothetical protein n=1 Tax=Rhodococcus sp. IEGM 1330 TaxID=3082225 RepID=UPI002955A10D|nr:hypothetical protein [Rhodococcus sp. IEGM 1330]
MTLHNAVNYGGLFLGILGAIPVLAAGSKYTSRWRRVRRILRFQRTGRVDIVLTTSLARKEKEDGGRVSVVRGLAPEGDILAMTPSVALLSTNFPDKQIVTHLSEKVRGRLDDDLVILGSSASNEYSADFMSRFNLARQLNLTLEVKNGSIAIDRGAGGNRLKIQDFDVKRNAEGLPKKDIAYIAIGPNPYNANRRAVVCAGFTTYGTGAASDVLFNDILSSRHSRERRLRKVLSNKSAFLIIECHLEFGNLVHWDELFSQGMQE